jgi:general secretion pathway protein G
MTRKNTGFTLVEILIVVIILGILAAIVIPQFTEASNDARVSAVVSDLQTVRSQIELYKIQHRDQYPGNVIAADGTITVVSTGAGFVNALLGTTDISGNPVARGSDGALGPYLGKFPTNGFCTTGGDTVNIVTADPTTGSPTVGWWFNTATGNFGINTTEYLDR